jgi:Rrf2 family protein
MGLVKSIRGKEGGYILTKAPNSITLKEVIENIEGSLLGITDSSKKGSIFLPIWIEVEKALSDVLEKFTFEDIANKVREMSLMYQI